MSKALVKTAVGGAVLACWLGSVEAAAGVGGGGGGGRGGGEGRMVGGTEGAREIAGGREKGREPGVSGKALTAPVSRLSAHKQHRESGRQAALAELGWS